MKTFRRRRIRNCVIFFSIAIFVVYVFTAMQTALVNSAFYSGWFLAGLVVLLASYNLYKKVPFLPLGSSTTWMQIHIYAGLLTAVVFLLHTGFRIPNGLFETILATFYLLVFTSGLVGLVLTRTLPARLSTRSEEAIYEEIPGLIHRLKREVEEAVFGCVSETETAAVPDFYMSRLKPFFEQPQYFWSHLFHSERAFQTLLSDIREQSRFLNDTEQAAMKGISERVVVKNDLDYQYALQSTLKYWLFLHVPLTYGLSILILFHVSLIYAFSGGVR